MLHPDGAQSSGERESASPVIIQSWNKIFPFQGYQTKVKAEGLSNVLVKMCRQRIKW